MKLDGRMALVTAGARGIGREITRGLRARGCRVGIAGRDAAALEAMAAKHDGRARGRASAGGARAGGAAGPVGDRQQCGGAVGCRIFARCRRRSDGLGRGGHAPEFPVAGQADRRFGAGHGRARAGRYQLEDAAPHLRAIEAIMPMVDTDMTAGRGSGKIGAEQAAETLLRGLEAGHDEIWIGKARLLRALSRLWPGLVARMLR